MSYIFPEIKDELYNYTWVDLYAGRGNLILPILEMIPYEERIEFFRNHIFLFDIQERMVQACIKKANSYGIPYKIAKKNIIQRDNLESFPEFLKRKKFPIFHITNPPYLYLGYIRKHKETKRHLRYFENENDGYQDLYQIAMINDLRNEVDVLTYIIPTNFLFGASVSNKFRMDFLKYYNIKKIYIFERKVFENTGTNVLIGFFKKKKKAMIESINFKGIKIKKDTELKRDYLLEPEYKYRGGAEFNVFLKVFIANNPLEVKYYLSKEEVLKNLGNLKLSVIDTNQYISNEYLKRDLYVNKSIRNTVISNILYAKTIDSGSYEKRAGIYKIRKDFNVDGIYVSKKPYRTSPIHIFLKPNLDFNDQKLIENYFNFILEYYRKKLDSEFLTTYKYSSANYTRKYLGLTQVRNLIKTFPIIDMTENDKDKMMISIFDKNIDGILKILAQYKGQYQKKTQEITSISNWL